MNRRLGWAAGFALLLALRLAHSGILWIEESYPAAAAIQILHGRLPYRDFFFDKPPLGAAVYLLWGALAGWPLRLAGGVFVLLCAVLAYRLARRLWGADEGAWAAVFIGFYLTFGVPAAVMALSPDMLMILPALACVDALAARGPFLAGLWSAAAFAIHTKAAAVVLLGIVWNWSSAPRFAAGFAAGTFPMLGVLYGFGALDGYWRQVWVWGSAYSRDTPTAHPLVEGLTRTLGWAGFQSAAVVAACWYWWRARATAEGARLLAWAVLALAMVILGWRFFPRYYLQLLPVAALAGARGLMLLPWRQRMAVAALLSIPFIRFGPRFARLAVDGSPDWADTAMNRDSMEAARIVTATAKPGNTILVWGYRPDILVYTRLPLGAPYLDSQPLTGVLADRHLTSSHVTFPLESARHRGWLMRTAPTFLVDGLGPYNPDLAVGAFPELRPWLDHYVQIGETKGSRIYRLNPVALALHPVQ